MRSWRGVVLSLLAVCALALPAAAEAVREAWRSEFATPLAVAVGPRDGSCWIGNNEWLRAGASLVHVAADGALLWRGGTFATPHSIAVDPTDGTVWVADGGNAVVHLSADGKKELFRSAAGEFYEPWSVSVDPDDGSCWVADHGHHQVVHLSKDGEDLVRTVSKDPFLYPTGVSVDPKDGSCWVSDAGNDMVAHLAADGTTVLWRSDIADPDAFENPNALAVNTSDGSCWVADTNHHQIVHLQANGTEAWRGKTSLLKKPWSVAVNPKDGSCWVADADDAGQGVAHLSSTGVALSSASTGGPASVAVFSTDGTCWVADPESHQALHLAADGKKVLWWRKGFSRPFAVSANSKDDSVWVASSNGSAITHLAATGEELWRDTRSDVSYPEPYGLAVNSNDGSCVVGESSLNKVVKFAEDGTQLWRDEDYSAPYSIAVYPKDGSYFIADTSLNQVVHLSADMLELARSSQGTAYFDNPRAVAVNEADGTVWVSDSVGNKVVHLDKDGKTLLKSVSGTSAPHGLAVAADGSVWVADHNHKQLVHFSAAGDELARFGETLLKGPESVAVNRKDGSVWVADVDGDQVLYYAKDGTPLWGSNDFKGPLSLSVDQADGSCWVADTEHGQVVHLTLVLDANFSATPTHGTAAPLEVAFTDLSTGGPTSWSWTFGDSGASTAQNPSHTYTALGAYTVALTVKNAGGSETETKEGYVTIAAVLPPVAQFSADKTSGTAPLAVQFADASTNTPTAWSWTFGDGSTSTDQSPSHTYATPGRYTVSLTATNAGGSDSETKARYLKVTFVDVPLDFWSLEQILACVEANIISGYSDGTYRPTPEVTRDQMAVYISRALAGGDSRVPAGPTTASFTDVPTAYWAFRYVEYAKSQKVVTGYSDNTYRPAVAVTRDQMAVYISRSVVDPTGDEGLAAYTPPATPSFPDVPADFWAYGYIEYAKAQNIVKGYDDGYRPTVVVTRDQMAVYVARAFELQ